MKQIILLVTTILLFSNILAQVKPASVPLKNITVQEKNIDPLSPVIEKKSSISGKVEGFGNDTVFIKRVNASNLNLVFIDTVLAKESSFTSTFSISETFICMIFTNRCFVKRQNGRPFLPETKTIKVFVEPGKNIEISGKLNEKYLYYIAKGDTLNQEFSLYRTSSLIKNVDMVNYMLKLDSMEEVGVVESIIDKLGEEYNKKKIESLAIERDYIKANPAKDLSAVFLMNLPLDSVPVYLSVLDENVKNGIFNKMIVNLTERFVIYKRTLDSQKKVLVGTKAPDFELKSLKGNIVKLSDFKNKYLVIDFWGSWCSWCIKGIPQMKEYYSKYKDKVEFIGIACRDKDDAWRSAIKKYGLDWVQLFNQTSIDAITLYGVTGFPTKFILDKNHKVVFKVIGEDPIFYKKLDELLGKE